MFQVGGLERVLVLDPGKLEMVDQVIVELGKRPFDAGGDGLGRVRTFQDVADLPGSKPEQPDHAGRADPAADAAGLDGHVEQGEPGQPAQGGGQAPHSQDLGFPAFQGLAQALEFR